MFMQAMAQFINDELLLTREKLNKKLVLFSKCTPEMKEQHPLRIESFYNILSTRNERALPGTVLLPCSAESLV